MRRSLAAAVATDFAGQIAQYFLFETNTDLTHSADTDLMDSMALAANWVHSDTDLTGLMALDTNWVRFDTDLMDPMALAANWTDPTSLDTGWMGFLEAGWRCAQAALISQAYVLPDHNVCKDSYSHPTHCHNADRS